MNKVEKTNTVKTLVVQQSVRYIFYLIAILMLCGLSIFAFKYLFREVKNDTKEALPWNNDSKEELKKEKKKIDEAKQTQKSVVVSDIEWKVL